MTATVVAAAAIFLWSVVSARLERADLTAPIVFTLVGALLAALQLVDAPRAPGTLKPLVELTLVWVLFSDAARVRVQDLRVDLGQCLRLLGIGLPLTVLAGWGLAAWLFPGLGIWLALLLAASLAPTDAALGVPVVTNPAVPSRIRRLLTIESGVNDGIATPIVLLAIAGAASAEGLKAAPALREALVELTVGAAVGAAVGFLGGWVLRWARHGDWPAEDFVGIGVLALALIAFGIAVAVHGNGFIAAFCGGLAFGTAGGRRGPNELVFLEQASALVSLLVWLAFGAIAVPIVLERTNAITVLYAVVSLTVVRMLPVGLAMLGAGLSRKTVLFVGWFGPRGLASILFALLALEQLGSGADAAVAVIAVTVFLSVLAHGVTASPLATLYGKAASRERLEPRRDVADIPVRGLPRRAHAAAARSSDHSDG